MMVSPISAPVILLLVSQLYLSLARPAAYDVYDRYLHQKRGALQPRGSALPPLIHKTSFDASDVYLGCPAGTIRNDVYVRAYFVYQYTGNAIHCYSGAINDDCYYNAQTGEYLPVIYNNGPGPKPDYCPSMATTVSGTALCMTTCASTGDFVLAGVSIVPGSNPMTVCTSDSLGADCYYDSSDGHYVTNDDGDDSICIGTSVVRGVCLS